MRGGLGHTPQVTERKAQLIEKNFRLLPESLATHQEWRHLVSTHSVEGVQVHDAMLAAVMIVYGVTHIVTFNRADFKRFGNITALLPSDV